MIPRHLQRVCQATATRTNSHSAPRWIEGIARKRSRDADTSTRVRQCMQHHDHCDRTDTVWHRRRSSRSRGDHPRRRSDATAWRVCVGANCGGRAHERGQLQHGSSAASSMISVNSEANYFGVLFLESFDHSGVQGTRADHSGAVPRSR